MAHPKLYLVLSCLLLIICGSTPSIAQVTISGRVVDARTGQPIQGASVYFNNTSIGTASNNAGEFFFSVATLPNTELVVSCIGYEILARRINAAEDNGKRFQFRLQAKKKELKEVLVLTKDTRKKWLALFRDNFLGLTEEGKRCRILNEESIYFTSGEEKNSFKAYSDTSIVIRNEMLGYIISFQLVEFGYDELTRSTYFYGYTRYEEMGSKNKWTKRRKAVYFGSTLHFYRALVADKINEEGYVIAVRKKINGDSIHRPRYQLLPLTAAQLAIRDSADTSLWRLNCEGDIMVQYNKRTTSFSSRFPVTNNTINPSLGNGTSAGIRPRADLIFVNNYGILEDPLSVYHFGYWTYEKMGNMLPFNYYPD